MGTNYFKFTFGALFFCLNEGKKKKKKIPEIRNQKSEIRKFISYNMKHFSHLKITPRIKSTF